MGAFLQLFIANAPRKEGRHFARPGHYITVNPLNTQLV
jgi:hypothetical protein